ncbi:hypothetical protein [Streptomyces sp. NPDC093225]|uniref:hypothetical protein n=1 Tax=Streptomyces sp. NPDC093225 TaxID=3366034 RepID=UPI00381DF841
MLKDVEAERVFQTQIHITNGEVVSDTDRAAHELRRAVRGRLHTEIARLRLEHPGRIPVRFSPTGRPVRAPERALGVDAGSLPLSGDVDQVPEFLRSLPRRQLVVLGPPGAGKSVLALLLAWDLLKTWQPGEPVPLLLSLSSWRPTVGLREWMAQRIRELGAGGGRSGPRPGRRRARADTARALLDENRVMPVLDGLDELPPALHAAAVEAIDAAVTDGLPLLVTCRGDEYETSVRESGRHLTRAAVVELDRVAPRDAIAYLEQSVVAGDRRWDPVFEALHGTPGSPLATALSSPLMLYLARTAYQAGSTDPGELLDEERFGQPEKIESHLLAVYLPAVCADLAAAVPRLAPARARRYLATVAGQMRRDETFDFAWWQVHSEVTGCVLGALFACSYGWFLYLLFGARETLFITMFCGLGGTGVHFVVRHTLTQAYVTEDVLRGPRGVLRQYALIGALSALAVGAFMGAAVGGWLRFVLGATPWEAFGFGARVGAVSGVVTLIGSAWGTYQVSRTWLWLTGRLPWRFWEFLGTAHELGVLRQTGAVHRFRHHRVQEQLSGGPTPAHRSVYRGKTAARRWRYLLPVLPSAFQALLALMLLFAVDHVTTGDGPVDLLSFRSGDRPDIEPPLCEGYCSRANDVWWWQLPPGASRRATLELPESDERSLTGWSGLVGAGGCPGAAVEVTLRMGDRPAAPFVLPNDDGPRVGLGPKAPFPAPVPQTDAPATLTLRRLDREPCELAFSWAQVGVHRDGLELARRRFGIERPGEP